ncbi:hypothetical protein MBLNU457_3826t1 [Dothideomycetes sp. NU457]
MISAEKAEAADLDLDVDTDNYATVAAEDTPTDSARTALSNEDFEKTRANYRAKIENGDIYKSLPSLLPPPSSNTNEDGLKPKLSKRHALLVTSAVGELYFYRSYQETLDLIARLRRDYDVVPEGDKKGKFPESLTRWEERCREQLAGTTDGTERETQ